MKKGSFRNMWTFTGIPIYPKGVFVEIGLYGALTGGCLPCWDTHRRVVPPVPEPEEPTGGWNQPPDGWYPLPVWREAATGGAGCRRDSPEMGDADVGWWWCRIPTCPTALIPTWVKRRDSWILLVRHSPS